VCSLHDLFGMSQKTSAPKRVINRQINVLVNRNGTSADLILRAAGDPITLIRLIIQGFIQNEAVAATARILNMEIWRADAAAGAALPTQIVTGILPYGDNDDLMWVGSFSILRETTDAGVVLPVNLDLKGMRKFSRSEDYIIRFAGDAAMVFDAVLTTFFKEV